MRTIEHKLICGCVIEVDAYHDWVDDLVGIDDMTILEQCDMHSGEQRIAELKELLEKALPYLIDYQHIFEGSCIEDINMLSYFIEDVEKELSDDPC